jgi:hypothetical protein
MLELRNYSKFLTRAREAQAAQTFKIAVANSLIHLCINGFYAYGLWTGGRLRSNQVKWRTVDGVDEPYSTGPITSVMFTTIIGAMSLG